MVTPVASTRSSDPHNAPPPPRRPKAREIASRYLQSSSSTTMSTSSKRSQSPKGDQHRAVSAERRRPPPSNAERMLVTSMRSLSVSFQGESDAVPLSKVKPPPTTVGTPGTLERRKAGVTPMRDLKDRENARPGNQQHQHRWPGRLRGQNSSSLLNRSLDYAPGRPQFVGSGSALKELRKSVADGTSRNKAGEHNDYDFRRIRELNGGSKLGDSMNSDVECGSSLSGKATHPKGRPRGLVVPARFCQDSSNRVHKSLDPDSALSSDGTISPFSSTKFQDNSTVSSSPREVFPIRGLSPLARPASPCKAMNSSRGILSPLRTITDQGISMNGKSNWSTPSMFPRKGQIDENRIADAHYLRLLHNCLLQWRLANAKLENTRLLQKHTAEHLVGSKRIELQRLKNNLKIYHILKEQEPHLECWGMFDRDHCSSVSSAIEALKASTIRLPIVGNAKADAHDVQEAISSAVDVMQTMASSVRSLFSKVEQINSLVLELCNASALEHHLLHEYKEFLSTTFIPLQVMHCSLRTHVLQHV